MIDFVICLWDSRPRQYHWTRETHGLQRKNMTLDAANIINKPLVDNNKISLPALYNKLGLMKQLVRTLDKSGNCSKYICRLFVNPSAIQILPNSWMTLKLLPRKILSLLSRTSQVITEQKITKNWCKMCSLSLEIWELICV